MLQLAVKFWSTNQHMEYFAQIELIFQFSVHMDYITFLKQGIAGTRGTWQTGICRKLDDNNKWNMNTDMTLW